MFQWQVPIDALSVSASRLIRWRGQGTEWTSPTSIGAMHRACMIACGVLSAAELLVRRYPPLGTAAKADGIVVEWLSGLTRSRIWRAARPTSSSKAKRQRRSLPQASQS